MTEEDLNDLEPYFKYSPYFVSKPFMIWLLDSTATSCPSIFPLAYFLLATLTPHGSLNTLSTLPSQGLCTYFLKCFSPSSSHSLISDVLHMPAQMS